MDSVSPTRTDNPATPAELAAGLVAKKSKSPAETKTDALTVLDETGKVSTPATTQVSGGPNLAPPSSEITADLLPVIKRLADALEAEPTELSPELQFLKQQLETGAKYAASEVILRHYVNLLHTRVGTLSAAKMANTSQVSPAQPSAAGGGSSISTAQSFSILDLVERVLIMSDEKFSTAEKILANFPKGDPEQLKRVLADAISKEMFRDQLRAELVAIIFSKTEIETTIEAAQARLAEVTAAIQNPDSIEGKLLGFWLRLAALAVGESDIRGALLGDLMDGVTAGRLPADSISQIAGPDAAAAASVAADFLANASAANLARMNPVGLVDLLRTGEWPKSPSEPTSNGQFLQGDSVLSSGVSESEIQFGLDALRKLTALSEFLDPESPFRA